MELTGALLSNLSKGSQTQFLEARLGVFLHRCVSILTPGTHPRIQDIEGPEGSCSITSVSPGLLFPHPYSHPSVCGAVVFCQAFFDKH